MVLSPHPAQALRIEHATLSTSLGDDWLTSVVAFSARRKQFRYREVDGFKLLTAPAGDVAGQDRGRERLNALIRAAWRPMMEHLHTLPRVPTLYLLSLPAWASGPSATSPHEASADNPALQEFSRDLGDACRQAGLPVHGARAFAGGAETCHRALAHGFLALRHDSPPAQIVLLTADSLCDHDVLLRDWRAQRIYARDNSSGWVPGEASAALLLRPVAAAEKSPASTVLHATAVVEAPEPSPRWPSQRAGDGRALERAVQAALRAAGLHLHHVRQHLSDSDGSSWRQDDMAAALGRLSASDSEHGWRAGSIQPAELLGQLGASWGAVQWALAAGLHRHGLADIGQALCSTQDIQGQCSAGVIECMAA
ncbi:hypothetical protein C8247_15165 [Paracidovorax avenae]|uniref:hypothetical protein n=1 Tax=Paracidovorax avenae TaxID=80867 RepID=UPI000D16F431|nr:hypothetical protein [Paracidovorax avenae]AVS71629.1 hypothetical protein C8247_15165 [Paracidovorax avenae]